MKTLLLRLIAIAGIANSSIIPVVANNHYSVNQIKTTETKTAEFFYNLNTNYPKFFDGYHHDYSNELSKFVSELKNFIADNNLIEWKITKAWSKFGKLEKEYFTPNMLEIQNEGLYLDNITIFVQLADIYISWT